MTLKIESRRGLIGLAAGLAVLAGGCMTNEDPQAQAAAQTGRQCFLPSQVSGFEPVGEDRVHVQVGAGSVYELQLIGACPDVDWANRIAIRSRGGSSWVCNGFDAELIVPSATGADRCVVRTLRLLSPEEAEAARTAGRTGS